MTRSFHVRPVPVEVLHRIVSLASRAPSAGKTQGWHLIVLEGGDTARFWDVTLPADRRASFRWQGLLRAPVIALALADPQAYVARYAEPDKVRTGLGQGVEAWPTPYWTIDGAMAVNTLLLAAHDEGLGALLFGVFAGEGELRESLGIPEHLQLLGAIAFGWPDQARPSAGTEAEAGASARRPSRAASEIIHLGGW